MAKRLYDCEDLLDDIVALLKEKLPAKIDEIAAIKSENGKEISLPQISEEAYFYQNWSDKILNYPVAIFNGVENIQASGSGPATYEAYRIFVEVVVIDGGIETAEINGVKTAVGIRKVNRYARAIREVLEDNFASLPWHTKTNIETVRPLSFTIDQNTSEEVKVGGVSITTGLA